MLKENQKIKMKWSRNNKKWYIDKGYNFTKLNDVFYVDAHDLSNGSHSKANVICDYCHNEIETVWRDFSYSIKKHEKTACKNCRQIRTSEENLIQRREYLYSNALKVCEENNLIMITPIENIKSADDRIIYNCPKHGNNETKIYTLMLGHSCPKCKIEKQKLTAEEIKRRIENYGTTVLNAEEYIDTTTKNLRIICRECGKEFVTSYNSFVCTRDNVGQFCPSCSKFESNGERTVRRFLEKNNIQYISQYRFEECRDKYTLPFDFFLPTLNKIIEYDGEQHYIPTCWNNINKNKTNEIFKYVQKHDKIKNNSYFAY